MLNSVSSNLKSEPVADNPFFQLLRDHYQSLYQAISQNGWRVCVPHSRSIHNAPLNEQFIKSHILQSSPFFKDEFVTRNGQCVTVRDGIISTKTGFETPCKAKILSEELFYTMDSKFTVYCISSPLLPVPNRGLESKSSSTNSTGHSHHQHSSSRSISSPSASREEQNGIESRAIEGWKEILKTSLDSATYKHLRESIETFTRTFAKSYVMLKGYTSWTSRKIKEYRDNTLREVIWDNPRYRNKLGSAEKEELTMAFDCVLNNLIYTNVFRQLLSHMHKEDEVLHRKIIDIKQKYSTHNNNARSPSSPSSPIQSNINKGLQKAVGIKDQFMCDFTLASKHLTTINDCRTPIHKLACLKKTSELIKEALDAQHLKDRKNAARKVNNEEDIAVTTDDMLSFFTYCVIDGELKHILATCEYLNYFHFSSHATSHLDYFAATFQGCVQYIQNEMHVTEVDDAKVKDSNHNSNHNHNHNNVANESLEYSEKMRNGRDKDNSLFRRHNSYQMTQQSQGQTNSMAISNFDTETQRKNQRTDVLRHTVSTPSTLNGHKDGLPSPNDIPIRSDGSESPVLESLSPYNPQKSRFPTSSNGIGKNTTANSHIAHTPNPDYENQAQLRKEKRHRDQEQIFSESSLFQNYISSAPNFDNNSSSLKTHISTCTDKNDIDVLNGLVSGLKMEDHSFKMSGQW